MNPETPLPSQPPLPAHPARPSDAGTPLPDKPLRMRSETQLRLDPPPEANGESKSPQRAPGSSRLPRPRPGVADASSGRRPALSSCSSCLLAGLAWWSGHLFDRAPFTGHTWTVRKEKLKVAIVERGSLESAKNGDIICTVRSGTKGSTIATTIKWIVDPGVEVKKGDKLIELDSSGFIEQLKDQNINVDQAKANWVTADEQYRIQESQNESDIEAAKNALDLAKIDLEKYIKGDFVQSLKDVEGRIETARSDLENWKDRAAWSARMAKKGLMSKVQADADDSRVDGSRIALEKVEEEKRVLVDYTKQRTVQDLTAKLAEAAGPWTASRARPRRSWPRPMPTACPRTPSTSRNCPGNTRSRPRSPSVRSWRRRTAWSSTTSPSKCAAAAARSNPSWPRASRSARARR